MKKYVCVHMHNYQPPRESPYTGKIERQPSAAPFPNWNARIDRECYATNGRARIMDGGGNVIGIHNNYTGASFNIGATLLTWMADFAPETLNSVVEGDRLSCERMNGHGNAIAQVYNHAIMPLCHDRDKKTQTVWGVKTFESFFHRKPEGMHLAETAVDVETLEALAAEGIKFTVLAPRQAKRWRKKGETNWQQDGGVDPSQAYQVNLPSGRTIAVFFYDGPVSQAVAFEKLLESGEKFRGRILEGFNDSRQHPQLMHISVDGETFGHHHKHGEMCLAWVFDQLEKDPEIELTSYGNFLALHPPTMEAEVWDNSSWSCSHGVERWRSNCGCNSGANGKWHQQWRKPLRDGLNHLRAQLDSLFDREGRKLFNDPWAARNDYIDVLLDGKTAANWFRTHAKAAVFSQAESQGKHGKHVDLLQSETFQKAISLMEMSRFGMLMFTSCAWFFDDIAGLEPVQNLRYAARAIELAMQFDSADLQDLEARFVAELKEAQCNLAQFGNGQGVWDQLVKPQAVAGELQLMFHSSLYRAKDVEHLDALIQKASKLGINFDAWLAQNRLLDAYAGAVDAGKMTDELKAAFEKLAGTLKVDKSVLGWNKGACSKARVEVSFKLPRVMHRRPGRRMCWHRETGKACK
jgi:alpha-amylase/alpha-mannosidase (GH57 family)